MKKQTLKFIILLMTSAVFSISLLAQVEQYSKVKVYTNKSQLQELAKIGIDITEGTYSPDEYLICDYSEKEILKIQDLGLDYEILIEDVSKYYVDRNKGLSTNPDDYKGTSEWEVPENFEFGSMGGHCTYDEVVTHINNMVNLYPNLITTKESIGQSIEGRDLWMVKISDNPNVNETEHEVLYTALHHAREPAGVMAMLFYMYYLLENYDSDPLIQYLIENSEMYFVPVVNPDGYVYNETNEPNGGGMWRKNRRDNGISGCEGVDPNRNYSYMWGINNTGSSPDPCDETYRGDSAFSEPEIIAIRDLVESHEFKFTLNFHTYGPWLLYPWAHTSEPCPDVELYHTYSTLMTEESKYYFLYYEANGDADDWMYGEQTTKEKIFSFTPELGGNNDGFWCSIDRIIPIAQESMFMNLLVVLFSGHYADINDTSPTLYEESSGDITFNLTRLGLEDGSEFYVELEPISDVISSVGDPIYFSNMNILETQEVSFPFELHSWVALGTPFQFVLTVDNGDYIISSDTITKIYGEGEVIFEDDCSTFENWISPNWNITTSSFYSPPACITDSPDGNYSNNHTSAAILGEDIYLPDNTYAVVNFQSKWEMEERNDYLQFQIKTEGINWTSLGGKYTVVGNTFQVPGDPMYTGFQTDWVQEEVNLVDFIGNSVNFRFFMKTNATQSEDGFYFDNFKVRIVDLATVEKEIESLQNQVVLSNPIPNPAKDEVRFNISNPGSDVLDFVVYNFIGQTVYATILSNNAQMISMDLNGWEAGIYFCVLKTDEGIKTRKIIKME